MPTRRPLVMLRRRLVLAILLVVIFLAGAAGLWIISPLPSCRLNHERALSILASAAINKLEKPGITQKHKLDTTAREASQQQRGKRLTSGIVDRRHSTAQGYPT